MPVSDTTREAAAALVKRYPVARSALLPLLHLVQADHGHITDEGVAFCAESLGLTKAEVGAVATFYTMFKRQPVGDWLLSVCTNPTCKIAGAQDIYDGYVEQLGGHHHADDGVTVEHAECLGICDAAPVVQVNYEMFGPVTKEQADELLAACRKGSPPASNWSNQVPRTFREVELELSGATDGVNDLLAAAARAQVESEVPPTYRSGETDIPVTHPGGDPKGIGGEVLRQRIDSAGRDETVRAGFGGVAGGAEAEPGTHGAPDDVGDEPADLEEEREQAEDTPHVAEEADAGERDAAGEDADEERGVAEERSGQAEDPTPQTPEADETPDAPPEGELPVEVTGGTATATDQSDVEDKVAGGAEAEPSTPGAEKVAGGAEAEPSTPGAEKVAGGAEAEPSTPGAEKVAGGAEAEPSTPAADDEREA